MFCTKQNNTLKKSNQDTYRHIQLNNLLKNQQKFIHFNLCDLDNDIYYNTTQQKYNYDSEQKLYDSDNNININRQNYIQKQNDNQKNKIKKDYLYTHISPDYTLQNNFTKKNCLLLNDPNIVPKNNKDSISLDKNLQNQSIIHNQESNLNNAIINNTPNINKQKNNINLIEYKNNKSSSIMQNNVLNDIDSVVKRYITHPRIEPNINQVKNMSKLNINPDHLNQKNITIGNKNINIDHQKEKINFIPNQYNCNQSLLTFNNSMHNYEYFIIKNNKITNITTQDHQNFIMQLIDQPNYIQKYRKNFLLEYITYDLVQTFINIPNIDIYIDIILSTKNHTYYLEQVIEYIKINKTKNNHDISELLAQKQQIKSITHKANQSFGSIDLENNLLYHNNNKEISCSINEYLKNINFSNQTKNIDLLNEIINNQKTSCTFSVSFIFAILLKECSLKNLLINTTNRKYKDITYNLLFLLMQNDESTTKDCNNYFNIILSIISQLIENINHKFETMIAQLHKLIKINSLSQKNENNIFWYFNSKNIDNIQINYTQIINLYQKYSNCLIDFFQKNVNNSSNQKSFHEENINLSFIHTWCLFFSQYNNYISILQQMHIFPDNVSDFFDFYNNIVMVGEYIKLINHFINSYSGLIIKHISYYIKNILQYKNDQIYTDIDQNTFFSLDKNIQFDFDIINSTDFLAKENIKIRMDFLNQLIDNKVYKKIINNLMLNQNNICNVNDVISNYQTNNIAELIILIQKFLQFYKISQPIGFYKNILKQLPILDTMKDCNTELLNDIFDSQSKKNHNFHKQLYNSQNDNYQLELSLSDHILEQIANLFYLTDHHCKKNFDNFYEKILLNYYKLIEIFNKINHFILPNDLLFCDNDCYYKKICKNTCDEKCKLHYDDKLVQQFCHGVYFYDSINTIVMTGQIFIGLYDNNQNHFMKPLYDDYVYNIYQCTNMIFSKCVQKWIDQQHQQLIYADQKIQEIIYNIYSQTQQNDRN